MGVRLVAAGLGAWLACLGVTAQAQPLPVASLDQQATVPVLDIPAVMPALAVATANQTVTVDSAGQHFIRATAANGLVIEVHFTACAEGSETGPPAGCKALYMTAVWGELAEADRATVAAVLAQFLAENPLANGALAQGVSPYLARYVIADFGIAKGNLLSEFANFVGLATAFTNQVNTAMRP